VKILNPVADRDKPEYLKVSYPSGVTAVMLKLCLYVLCNRQACVCVYALRFSL
jgi:hypothetical protein